MQVMTAADSVCGNIILDKKRGGSVELIINLTAGRWQWNG